ncbi:flagellar basal body protein [Cryobacterium sp. Y11]|uniref:flagellar basal body rod protein FlgB n=1 Tax=Cryobacterium sp. Y11 TaxID=2045016 RepID=UPI000CE495BA|nr:flagellar basal body protein [Cryobacterium sp. Y11]
MLDSVTSVALTSALDGLALRQRTIASNIANINTPNYHAKVVSFENALAKSVQAGDGKVTASTTRSIEATNLIGNNVNLDTETLANIDALLRYQFAARAIDGPASAIRSAIRTS